MQDLPQQPPDYEVVIPLEQGDHGGVIQNDLEFQVLEPPTPPTAKLEEKDLFNLTHFLHRKYEKGFTWSELPQIKQRPFNSEVQHLMLPQNGD